MAFAFVTRLKDSINKVNSQVSDVARLLKPYFLFRRANTKNLLLLASIISLCLIRAMLIVLLSDVGTTWFSLFNAEGLILNNIIAPTLLLFGIYLPLDALCDSLITYCSRTLSNQVAKQMNNDYINKFYTSKIFHGIKLPNKDKHYSNKIYTEVLSKNIKQFTGSIIEPVTTIMTAFVGAGVSLIQLFYLSPGLQIATGFTLPFYLPLMALAYGLFSVYVLHKFTGPIHSLSRKESKLLQRKQSHLYYSDNHSESIALLKGGKFESQYLQKISSSRYDTKQKKLKYKFGREFIKKLSDLIAYPLGALVCIPGLIAGLTTSIIDRNHFFAISTHFTKILSFFNSFAEHHDKWISFVNAQANIKMFDQRSEEWCKRYKKLKENFTPNNKLGFKGSIQVNNNQILEDQKISIKPGKTYLLSAPSGAGKSTLLKTFAGINPSFTGKIKLPKKTVFVTQSTYLLKNTSSLLDNIVYPKSRDQYPAVLLAKIPHWLEELKIKKSIIRDLGVAKKNWDQLLSPGEKQRIAIVRALLQQPECLIMDEPTSAIGPNYARLVKSLVRKELPNATILYTDHNPTEGYPDEKIIELSPPRVKMHK
ncbi:ATP-binding cassette domain-containing protein [Candidatus Berkiella aquae]|uniref:ATP-binding cassette domain-containing protein n=1 Tax=Candidatus Berkiella aquae TaxID=295108 RepID=A0A0Q9YSF9_9GAMM|nr:ATP-binding cassette domain-containing protein [Candidatus Berkiella aquae]MCS5710770.1 ATP-binding cassette domain-containing protein [Candidatus Berkiella aquae]